MKTNAKLPLFSFHNKLGNRLHRRCSLEEENIASRISILIFITIESKKTFMMILWNVTRRLPITLLIILLYINSQLSE